MIGQRLVETRRRLGITQTELAKSIGVKPAEISQYESGKRTPRWDKFNKILDELDISADYLLGREISVVSEEDESYKARISKNDLKLLQTIKSYPNLYNVLINDSNRSVKVINNNLRRIYPD